MSTDQNGTAAPLVALTIPQPDRELFQRAESSLAAAKAARITSTVELDSAGADLMAIKAMQKALEAKRTAITDPLNDALKSVNDLFRPAKNWLEEAESVRKGQMIAYRQEQEEKARAEQAKLDEAARKERERLAAKAAEAERVAKEKADALRAAATNEEERVAAERAAAKKEADAAAKAEAMRAQAAEVVAPRVVTEPPKTAGQSVRETWTYEVVDLALVPREYMLLDQARVGAVVRAMKGLTNIPGIKAVRGETISSRSS